MVDNKPKLNQSNYCNKSCHTGWTMKTMMWGHMHQNLRANVREIGQNWVNLFMVKNHVKMVLNEKTDVRPLVIK